MAARPAVMMVMPMRAMWMMMVMTMEHFQLLKI
jgi:hypothetical protein